MMTFFRSFRRQTQGFSLVELLVYILISGVVIAIVAGIFISMNSVQNQVVTSNTTSVKVQSSLNSLKNGIRNAVAFQLEPEIQVVTAKTYDSTEQLDFRCVRWWFDKEQNELLVGYADDNSGLPEAGSRLGWTVLSDELSPVTESGEVFEVLNDTMIVTMKTNNLKGIPTQISVSITPSSPQSGSSPCF